MSSDVQNLHAEGFGPRVQSARSTRQLTQEDAAALLGMSRRTLAGIEAGDVEPRPYERAGILAMLAPERPAAEPRSAPRVWRRLLLGTHQRPRAWIDLEEHDGRWFAACGFDNGRVGGLDTFKGPFGSREAAERNAAAFGCDFMAARGLHVMRQVIRRMFQFPSRGADSALSALAPWTRAP